MAKFLFVHGGWAWDRVIECLAPGITAYGANNDWPSGADRPSRVESLVYLDAFRATATRAHGGEIDQVGEFARRGALIGGQPQFRGVISTQPGLHRYLRVTPGGLLRIDAGKAKAEENLDGTYLLRTSRRTPAGRPGPNCAASSTASPSAASPAPSGPSASALRSASPGLRPRTARHRPAPEDLPDHPRRNRLTSQNTPPRYTPPLWQRHIPAGHSPAKTFRRLISYLC
jgi:hypothetical protein